MAQFQIASGKVNLTDPCYDVSTWCGSYGVPAKNGTWIVEVEHTESYGKRVAGWVAYHQDHKYANTNPLSTDFGVDSGQFGIFDASTYVGDTDDDNREWYFAICDLICGDNDFGVTCDNLGFVSRTGWGDGGYDGEAAYDDNGDLVKFAITFIRDEDDEEEKTE